MKKKGLISLMLCVVLMVTLFAGTALAATNADGSTLVVSRPDSFKVGEAVEFTVSTTKGGFGDDYVYGKVTYDASKVEKPEYLESNDRQWHELTGSTFGPPDTGFPLMDATSKFRVTFKEAGETEVTVQILKKENDDVVLEETSVFTSVDPVAPTLTVTKPNEFKVGVATEFSVSTTKGDYAGGNVIGTAVLLDDSKIDKLEYFEVNDNTWKVLSGDSFGPQSGFPLMDITSKFRVTFKEAGDTSVTVKIVTVEGQELVAEAMSQMRMERWM